MIYHGNFLHTPSLGEIEIIKSGYLHEVDGKVVGLYQVLPNDLCGQLITDFGDTLVLPAFVNLHVHTSQLPNRGVGYDEQLPQWLDLYTYPTEHKYAEAAQHKMVNKAFLDELWAYGMMRCVHMCTTDETAAKDLFDQYLQSGMGAMIGKMNSDQNPFGDSPNEDTQYSKESTKRLVEYMKGKSSRVSCIISPEFAPCCTREILEYCGALAQSQNLPVMTHLAEGESDIELIEKLFDYADGYGDVYDKAGLFGQTKTAMIHSIYATKYELELMRDRGITLVYCPVSNFNLPPKKQLSLRKVLDMGIDVGLGSDVGAGQTNNMCQNMVAAIWLSKADSFESGLAPLSVVDTLYLATKGGGQFFGQVGSFEKGYAFDCIVIDDTSLCVGDKGDLKRRLERYVYTGDDRQIVQRYCDGAKIER